MSFLIAHRWMSSRSVPLKAPYSHSIVPGVMAVAGTCERHSFTGCTLRLRSSCLGLPPSAQPVRQDMPSTKWIEGPAATATRKERKTAEDPDEQALLALVVTKQEQMLRGAVAELVGIEVGVVSGVFNLESSGVEASDWRP